uniref:CSON013604 protein n=1 Tax=Culicoides sonorensis TaxID=179676 RepID=A0A336MDY2_CULSO
MFVPAFMVASQVGWYMLALKLVSTLAIKALLVAKLAFFVAALITIKKLILEPMHVSSPITPFYDHVDPYIVPFDFSTLGHQDFHPLSIAHLGHSETPLASASVLHQSNHIPVEGSTIALNESRSGDSTTASSLSQTKSNKRTDFLQGKYIKCD